MRVQLENFLVVNMSPNFFHLHKKPPREFRA